MKYIIAILLLSMFIHAQNVPMLVNYQAKFEDDNGLAIEGTLQITFSLYDDLESGTLIWSESHSSVASYDGIVSVLLGSVNPFEKSDFSGSLLFIETDISGYGVLTPRQQMTSVPYAIRTGNSTPPGSINVFAGTESPTGWFLCNGQVIDRDEYSNLFDVIGTTYGDGDGSSTFNLPDLSGRNPIGYKSDEESFDSLGEIGGSKEHTLSSDEIPTFTKYSSHSSITNNGTGGVSNGVVEISTTTFGGGSPHNILDPYIVMNYIIKY